jgi:hypothetical protein
MLELVTARAECEPRLLLNILPRHSNGHHTQSRQSQRSGLQIPNLLHPQTCKALPDSSRVSSSYVYSSVCEWLNRNSCKPSLSVTRRSNCTSEPSVCRPLSRDPLGTNTVPSGSNPRAEQRSAICGIVIPVSHVRVVPPVTT